MPALQLHALLQLNYHEQSSFTVEHVDQLWILDECYYESIILRNINRIQSTTECFLDGFPQLEGLFLFDVSPAVLHSCQRETPVRKLTVWTEEHLPLVLDRRMHTVFHSLLHLNTDAVEFNDEDDTWALIHLEATVIQPVPFFCSRLELVQYLETTAASFAALMNTQSSPCSSLREVDLDGDISEEALTVTRAMAEALIVLETLIVQRWPIAEDAVVLPTVLNLEITEDQEEPVPRNLPFTFPQVSHLQVQPGSFQSCLDTGIVMDRVLEVTIEQRVLEDIVMSRVCSAFPSIQLLRLYSSANVVIDTPLDMTRRFFMITEDLDKEPSLFESHRLMSRADSTTRFSV